MDTGTSEESKVQVDYKKNVNVKVSNRLIFQGIHGRKNTKI